VPYSAFEASDGFVVLGAINELMWERLCEAFGLDDLRTDQRAATNDARVRNRELVEAAIAGVIAPLSTADVTETLKQASVLVAPVRGAARAVEDPQVAELGLIDEIDGVRFARSPLSQFNSRPLAPAQRLGQDTTAVLTEHLSLTEDELGALIADGVVHTAASADAAGPPAPGAAQAASTWG
jgi:CoA:oxalate CoA-transferase